VAAVDVAVFANGSADEQPPAKRTRGKSADEEEGGKHYKGPPKPLNTVSPTIVGDGEESEAELSSSSEEEEGASEVSEESDWEDDKPKRRRQSKPKPVRVTVKKRAPKVYKFAQFADAGVIHNIELAHSQFGAGMCIPRELMHMRLVPTWELETNDYCTVCEDGGDMICCEFCNLVYHLNCLTPALSRPPHRTWACPSCAYDFSQMCRNCNINADEAAKSYALHKAKKTRPVASKSATTPSRKARPKKEASSAKAAPGAETNGEGGPASASRTRKAKAESAPEAQPETADEEQAVVAPHEAHPLDAFAPPTSMYCRVVAQR
jgi:hypothetical protein